MANARKTAVRLLNWKYFRKIPRFNGIRFSDLLGITQGPFTLAAGDPAAGWRWHDAGRRPGRGSRRLGAGDARTPRAASQSTGHFPCVAYDRSVSGEQCFILFTFFHRLVVLSNEMALKLIAIKSWRGGVLILNFESMRRADWRTVKFNVESIEKPRLDEMETESFGIRATWFAGNLFIFYFISFFNRAGATMRRIRPAHLERLVELSASIRPSRVDSLFS